MPESEYEKKEETGTMPGQEIPPAMLPGEQNRERTIPGQEMTSRNSKKALLVYEWAPMPNMNGDADRYVCMYTYIHRKRTETT